jgi:hypothetical protein
MLHATCLWAPSEEHKEEGWDQLLIWLQCILIHIYPLSLCCSIYLICLQGG